MNRKALTHSLPNFFLNFGQSWKMSNHSSNSQAQIEALMKHFLLIFRLWILSLTCRRPQKNFLDQSQSGFLKCLFWPTLTAFSVNSSDKFIRFSWREKRKKIFFGRILFWIFWGKFSERFFTKKVFSSWSLFFIFLNFVSKLNFSFLFDSRK